MVFSYVFQILILAVISLVLAGVLLRKANGELFGVPLRAVLIGAFGVVANFLSAYFGEASVLTGANVFVILLVGIVTGGVAILALKIEKVRILLGAT